MGDKKSPCLSLFRRALFCPPEEGFSFSEPGGVGKWTENHSKWAWAQSNFCQKNKGKEYIFRTRRQADD
ncbi:hypothetical protein D1B31_03635 [Neobacillus notoginsengisoli]|uniref:Uncharacterized protein n=1 Tax=Neobacillus notoginsengisoli TaxID=1578198 RepID=A0A417YY26_9BACI|nr:hypothetical protein D1B31_03635 [Neobacillus notoginsengisoli]